MYLDDINSTLLGKDKSRICFTDLLQTDYKIQTCFISVAGWDTMCIHSVSKSNIKEEP